jgi:hypothetical protein
MLRKNKFVFLIFFQSVQQVCAAAHAGHTQQFGASGGNVLRMTIFRIIEVQFFGQSLVLISPACAKLRNVMLNY